VSQYCFGITLALLVFFAELIENIKPVKVYHNLKEKISLLFKENKTNRVFTV
jgi:hypothetical protein